MLGFKGIERYDQLRKNAISASVKYQHRRSENAGTESHDIEGDFFHDGQDVLPAIGYWHEFLRRYIRGTDKITGEVLDLISKRMLLSNVKDRIDADALCVELARILQHGPAEPPGPLPECITDALNVVERRVQTMPRSLTIEPERPGSSAHRSRNVRKSQNRSRAIERSEYFAGALAVKDINLPSIFMDMPGPPSTWHAPIPIVGGAPRSLTSSSPSGESLNHRPQSYLHTHTKNAGRTRNPPDSQDDQREPQNVFQAYAELQTSRQNSILSSRIPWRKKKDQFLAKFFNNRDIVSLPRYSKRISDGTMYRSL